MRDVMIPRDKIAKRLFFEEEGAVLIITAVMLIVLIGFAALAVDLGALFVERRHAQTAADVGVLSGAQFAEIDELAVIAEVKRITANNLESTEWGTCVDTDRPAEFSPVAGETDCISFTFGLAKIRVRVPDQTLNTYFAGVLGVDTLTASAPAEAKGHMTASGDILPFGVPNLDASSTVGCPSDHPNGLYPCNGPDAGNFNHLNVTQWGIDPPPDPPVHDCTYSNGGFEDNLAGGVDHLLGLAVDNPDHDQDACNGSAPANINDPPGVIQSKTGVAQSLLMPGLITGSASGTPGRLTDIPFSSTPDTIMGRTLDNEPLWSFIGNYPTGSPSIADIPDSCQGDTFKTSEPDFDWDEDLWVSLGGDPTDDPDFDGSDPDSLLEDAASFEHMARCLREYRLGKWEVGPVDGFGLPVVPYPGLGYTGPVGDGLLFTKDTAPGTNPEMGIYDLQLSPRWGWSPVGAFSTGTNPFPITAFKPIYIQTLVAECNNTSCGWVWHAGQTPPAGDPGGNKIQSLLSFQLPTKSLPESVTTYAPGSADLKIPYTLIK